jgi:hypothetical protein
MLLGPGTPAWTEAGGVPVLFLVGGIAWFATRRGDFYALPAEAAVGAPALAAAAEGGRFPGLRLPSGRAAVRRRDLPLVPQPVDRVFPLGAAEVPWSPPRDGGVADLGRTWQRLLREREAFTPWDEPNPERERLARRLLPPRSTFRLRAGADEEIDYLYPQVVPADLLYRLGPGYLRLPERGSYEDLAVLRGAFRLTAAARGRGPAVTATLSRRPSGAWVVAVAGARDEVSAASAEEALRTALEPLAPLWRLEPPAAESPLLIVAGR